MERDTRLGHPLSEVIRRDPLGYSDPDYRERDSQDAARLGEEWSEHITDHKRVDWNPIAGLSWAEARLKSGRVGYLSSLVEPSRDQVCLYLETPRHDVQPSASVAIWGTFDL